MKSAQLAFASLAVAASAVEVNPIEKVLELLDDLKAKIKKEGAAEDQAFKEFFEWCDDAAKNAKFSVKTAKSEQESLEATIAKAVADDTAATSEIEKLTASISASESDLKDAQAIRDKEKADFTAVEGELVDAVDTLDRAIGILEREMSKNPALLQKRVNSANVQQMLQVFDAVINSAGVASSDRKKLMALVQDTTHGDDDSDELGAPAAAGYKSQSGSIVDIIQDMKEKSESELSDARKGEASAAQNFAILKQSLDDQIAADTKDLNNAKSTKSGAAETKAVAQGDLDLAVKDLEDGNAALATVSGDCMTSASSHEASQKSRSEELEALGVAQKAITDSSSGAAERQYAFFQIDSNNNINSHFDLVSHTELVHLELVNLVKGLAAKQHSAALNQLASRINVVLRYGVAAGQDPFVKIKGLITDMIAKLEGEADAETAEKEYCDSEMAKTSAKQEELGTEVDRLATKIEKAAATSTRLKEEVSDAQKDLYNLAKTQDEMNKARKDENNAFVAAKSDLEGGIAGLQTALQVLRDYYNKGSAASLLQLSGARQPSPPAGHSAAGGAGGGIIGMLEVVESDFSDSLAKITVEEDTAAATFEERSHDNKVTKALKEQDVKYKTAESKSLDKAIAEHSSDKAGLDTQFAAVMEYKQKITDRCVAKPESYEDRKKRREEEISGLKQALQILESETAFVQKQGKGRSTRRLRLH